MLYFLKKPSFLLIFLSIFCYMQANEYPVGRKLVKPRNNNKELNPGYNESANVQVRGSWDIFLTGSFIYWQPIEENLDLAYSTNDYSLDVINKKYYKMKFDWDPGLKISFGVTSDHDRWSVIANYTWLHTKNEASYGESASDMISPYTIEDTTGIYNFFATWYMDIDLINLNLGRKMHMGQKLIIYPYAAISLACIDQKYYFNTTAKNGDFIYQPYSRDKTGSWGLGPKIGIDAEWKLTNHLKCLTNASGDILYTSYRIRNKSYHIFQDGSLHDIHTKLDRKTLRGMANIAAGIAWESYFLDDFWHIEIATLYEFHLLWDQNMLRPSSEDSNLYLNGLTLTAKLDF